MATSYSTFSALLEKTQDLLDRLKIASEYACGDIKEEDVAWAEKMLASLEEVTRRLEVAAEIEQ